MMRICLPFREKINFKTLKIHRIPRLTQWHGVGLLIRKEKIMKNLVGLLAIMMMTVSVAFAGPKKPKSDLKIIAVKSHSVYFKVDKSFIGGTVEIYDSNKTLLEAEYLPHTHTMVFFHEKPSGKYMIKVRKGNKKVEFGYINI